VRYSQTSSCHPIRSWLMSHWIWARPLNQFNSRKACDCQWCLLESCSLTCFLRRLPQNTWTLLFKEWESDCKRVKYALNQGNLRLFHGRYLTQRFLKEHAKLNSYLFQTSTSLVLLFLLLRSQLYRIHCMICLSLLGVSARPCIRIIKTYKTRTRWKCQHQFLHKP
jgi:hypothetical protein